ncbi:MAG TPA: hypothetical protein VJ891_09625 [Casimicrobiaceae bacterium]|nr:hypothetical protein [Casimicrobiaceae bacterium]
MASYDSTPKVVTSDQGGGSGFFPGEMPAAGGVPVPCGVIWMSIAAGAGGAADDVTVYNASCPTKYRIVDCFFICTTNVATKNVTVRDASGGGGNALSSALSCNATGTARNNLTSGTKTVAQNGSIYLRRDDSGIAGELCILVLPTL